MDVATNVTERDWKEGSIVALTPWLEDLSRARMPAILREVLMTPSSTNSSNIQWSVTLEEASQLAQWSDLLLFDYLTGTVYAPVPVSSGPLPVHRVCVVRKTELGLRIKGLEG